MRVLTALTYYYPHWTGLTAYAQRLAEGLAARGHDVTVVTSRFDAGLAKEEVHNGVRVVRVKPIFRLSRGQVMPGYLPTMWRLLADHDIVQVHTPMLETWPTGLLTHLRGCKMVMTHHGDLVMPSGFWNQFVQLTVGFLLDRGAASADLITIHSQDYANHSAYLQPFADKVRAIYPPVEIPVPDEQAARVWREELGFDGPVIGFAGRFVEEKGFDYLLKAVPLVLEQMPKANFVYAGDHDVVYEGFYQRWAHLVERYEDHVHVLGLITDRQRLANFFGMCDLFVLPSRTDCFPSVQIEAMLCETPVVTTDIPGAREAVQASGAGLLVEPRDEEALAQGLLRVLYQPQRWTKTREEIRSVFNTADTVAAYECLLQELVDRS